MQSIERLARAIESYRQRYPEEAARVKRFQNLLSDGVAAFRRGRREGHFTASAWVVDEMGERLLLVHHRKLDKWLQPGGHADGELDLLRVAQKEVREETGVETVAPSWSAVFDIDIHPIPARGAVPGHEHFDVRYVLVAPGRQEPIGNDETHGAQWVELELLEGYTVEESILRMRRKWEETRLHPGGDESGARTAGYP